MGDDRGGEARAQGVAFEHGPGIGEAAGVGHGGSRGDDIERVADNIGEDEGHHGGRVREAGEPAALERLEVLAQAVDLADARATGEQFGSENLHIGQAETRGGQGEQGRATAGDQDDDQIARTETLQQDGEAVGSRDTARIGHGMAGLHQFDRVGGGAAQVAVLDHHQAGVKPGAEQVGDGVGHGGAGLAGTNHQHPVDGAQVEAAFTGVERIAVAAQNAAHSSTRLNRAERCGHHPGDGVALRNGAERGGPETTRIHVRPFQISDCGLQRVAQGVQVRIDVTLLSRWWAAGRSRAGRCTHRRPGAPAARARGRVRCSYAPWARRY